MTRDQFLAKLRETPRTWSLSSMGMIRIMLSGERCCPIGALVVETSPMLSLSPLAGLDIGLNAILCERIADAADKYRVYDPALRAQLLDACGLPPEPRR